MTSHILCTECSEDLAELFLFYEKVKNAYCKTELSKSKEYIHEDLLELKTDVIKNFAFILDALGLKKECCRMRMISIVDFDDMIYN